MEVGSVWMAGKKNGYLPEIISSKGCFILTNVVKSITLLRYG